MPGFLHDLRFAVRGLLATRWTTAAAVLILALGTGVNTAVLAVTYGILLRPLPYSEPSRIVVIAAQTAEGNETGMPGQEFEEWQRRLRTVDQLSAYSGGEFTVRGAGDPRVARMALVKGPFFQLLGVRPMQGTAAAPGSEGWVALTESFASSVMPGRSLVGEPITIGQARYTVSSVMPDRFSFPSDDVVAWLPSSSHTAIGFAGKPDQRSFRLVARLKPGVTVEQARDDVSRVLREIRPAPNPEDKGAKRFALRGSVSPVGETLTRRVRPVLGALLAAAVMVLLVSCGNVASLFITRASSRRHDLAVRLALGASRWRLARAVLAESLVVAVAASAVGLWIGYALVRVFVGIAAGVLPRLNAVALDAPVMAASAAVALVITLLSGGLPAFKAARSDFALAFRGAKASSSRQARQLRNGLVVVQIALAIVLLVGAGLVSRTVSKLLEQASGIQPDNVVSMRLVMTDTTTFAATSRVPFLKQVVERVGVLPGVESVGVGSALPPRVAPLQMGIRVVSNGRDEFQALTLISVTPGYLEGLGARLVRGRMFRDADMEGTEGATLLSESAARLLAPTQDPVGRPLVFPLPAAVAGRNRRPPVVGVVGDIKYTGLDSKSLGAVYVLWPDLPAGVGHMVVRLAPGSPTPGPALLHAIRDVDPTLPVPEVRLLDDEILDSIRDRRMRVVPAVSFAILALVVAMVGLSAAMSRAISERRRELAIRGALGASPARTLRMILLEAGAVSATGVALGLLAAWAVRRGLSTLLYGIPAHDPLTFGCVALLVMAGATGVCYLAARRTLGINPIELLRVE